MENRLSVESDDEISFLHFKRKKLKLSPSTNNNYSLRENPKKTWRIGEGSIDSQSSETTVIESTIPNRRKRSERKNRYGSDIHHQEGLDEEEVAMCLIMLSRDNNKNKNKNKNSMLDFDLSDNNSCFGENPDRDTAKVASLKDLKEKNTQFECTTCNKMFDSYQALGGHRASHKKNSLHLLNASPDEIADEAAAVSQPKRRRNKKKDSKSDNRHECPICFKVFQSGQALGGHKRSHLLLASEGKNRSQASVVVNPVPEIRSFLDLNLPAPTEDEDEEEEEEEISCSTVGTFKLHQPWWVEANLKHESAIGLIAN